MSTNLPNNPQQNDNVYSQSLDSLNINQQQAVVQQVWNYDQSNVYVPSSSEKKKCVLMYILFWILMMINKQEVTEFEYFHLKQSIWWWVMFLIVFIIGVIFIFIPYIRLLWILPLFVMVCFWLYFVFQVWNWKYMTWKANSLWLFGWLGWWILWLFESEMKVAGNITDGSNVN